MVQVQVNLNKQQNKTVEIYKAKKGLRSKAETIKQLINEKEVS